MFSKFFDGGKGAAVRRRDDQTDTNEASLGQVIASGSVDGVGFWTVMIPPPRLMNEESDVHHAGMSFLLLLTTIDR